MIINNATQLLALFTSFVAKYQDIYQQTPVYLDKLATTTTTMTEIVRFPWMGQLPTVREWVGDRQVNSAGLKFYDVVPKLWESTFGVNKDKIDDDQFGFFASHILPQMAMNAKKYPDYAVVDFIRSNPLWADGKTFFATDHPIHVDDASIKGVDGNNYYKNDYSNLPLTHDNYALVRQAMMSQVGENGKNLNIIPDTLIYPPQLEAQANLILKAEMIAPGAFQNQTTQVGAITNVLKGSAAGLLIPDFAPDDDTWYLADMSKPIKPFLWVLREAWNVAVRVDPRDPVVFEKNEYRFGGRGRGAAGGGFPFLISRAAA